MTSKKDKKIARKKAAKPQAPKREVPPPEAFPKAASHVGQAPDPERVGEPVPAPRPRDELAPPGYGETRAHVPRTSTSRVTPGRIVMYREHVSGNVPMDSAAIVSRVLDDGWVELHVFSPTGVVVKPRVNYSTNRTPGMWSWPELV